MATAIANLGGPDGRAPSNLPATNPDRARDFPERLRTEVAKRLVAIGAKETWVRALCELVGEEERVAILGEGLPIGLRLKEQAWAARSRVTARACDPAQALRIVSEDALV